MIKGIVYFGMGGMLSSIPLSMLLNSGLEINAVIMPRQIKDNLPIKKLPLINKSISLIPLVNLNQIQNTYQIAISNNIPVYSVGNFGKSVIEEIAKLEGNLIVTSCFPWKIPQSILSLFEMGGINLHPSLIPQYKGPSPTFWQFKSGVKDFGVSIHQMSDTFDAGKVLSQVKVIIPRGTTSSEADNIFAQKGGKILVDYLSTGISHIVDTVDLIPSYQGKPEYSDKELLLHWTVERAFDFVRCASDYAPFWIKSEEFGEILVHKVISFEKGVKQKTQILKKENGFSIQFSDGILLVI